MDWARQGGDWPNRGASRFVTARPHVWHLQELGAGPVVLLLHGAGGATHSWRDLMPALAQGYRVVALDLPGQGFSRAGNRLRLGLDGMAEDIAALLAQEGIAPQAIVGHSAGGALALRLAEVLPEPPRAVVGLNAALGKFRGMAGWLFPLMARALATNPLSAALFSRTASSEASVRALIRSTGSQLDAGGLALYRALLADRGHVDGTLAMMAQWNLDPLLAGLERVAVPVLLLTGGRDTAVPPQTSARAAARMRAARWIDDPAHGHLMHEEAPETTAAAITAFLRTQGVG
ncbi:alpha/beta fold hydrolase BchO [Rhodobaculum claviforme]|uniref:Magnesium chelatase n=1 Tax=Rhodobaculum claviforme TaxID=1549854 RepID=A0A934TJU3_9RHOB|nr:magnesium chelatase [Rhodobaculum claviforme]